MQAKQTAKGKPGTQKRQQLKQSEQQNKATGASKPNQAASTKTNAAAGTVTYNAKRKFAKHKATRFQQDHPAQLIT